MQQRSLLVFQNSLKSPETIKSYTWYLDKFIEYYKLRNYDSVLQIPKDQLQIMIEDYIMAVKKKIRQNSVPNYYYPLQAFLEANDIDLRWKKIKKLFPAKTKSTGNQAYTTQDVRNMLGHTTNVRNKAIIHFIASTGCRIGALPPLRIRHVIQMPLGCKVVVVYEDSLEEYVVFLTPEASAALDKYLARRKSDGEQLTGDSPLFRRKYVVGMQPAQPMTTNAAQNVIGRAAMKASLRTDDLKKNGRFEKMLDHGFRKRFTTILKMNKDIPVAITERLLGHATYRDEHGVLIKHDRSYMRAEVSQLFEHFKKAILELTVDPSERLRIKNSKLEQELSKYQKHGMEIEKLKKQSEYDHMVVATVAKFLKHFGIELPQIDGESYEADEEEIESYIQANFPEFVEKRFKYDSKLDSIGE